MIEVFKRPGPPIIDFNNMTKEQKKFVFDLMDSIIHLQQQRPYLKDWKDHYRDHGQRLASVIQTEANNARKLRGVDGTKF